MQMKLKNLIYLFSSISILTLCGCAAPTPAPIADRVWDKKTDIVATKVPEQNATAPAANFTGKFHEVQKGETLYSIAFQHGVDYHDVAKWNNMENVNVLNVGQRLRLSPPDGAQQTNTITEASGVIITPLGDNPAIKTEPTNKEAAPNSGNLKTEPKAVKRPYSEKALAELQAGDSNKSNVGVKPEIKPNDSKAPSSPNQNEVDWTWPTKGKPKTSFTESTKGIDISGTKGQPIVAVGNGKVIHVGSNLRGYGKLVIIQHSATFLSAYAHNSQILVKEGDQVTKGQKIAEMGDTDTDQVKLHFEIRRLGKPVDPLKYLPDEKAQ